MFSSSAHPSFASITASRLCDPAFFLLFALALGLFVAFRSGAIDQANRAQANRANRASRSARAGVWIASIAWASLFALSTPVISGTLVRWVEENDALPSAALEGVPLDRRALVVLAGGLRTHDPTISPREKLDGTTQSRVMGAARLYKAQGFGLVILSGGPEEESEGMRDLITALGVPEDHVVRESSSTDTRENALESARILRGRGIETVVLCTSALHMRRARREFARAGVEVLPASVDPIGAPRIGADAFLPSSMALGRAHQALHELLGYVEP